MIVNFHTYCRKSKNMRFLCYFDVTCEELTAHFSKYYLELFLLCTNMHQYAPFHRWQHATHRLKIASLLCHESVLCHMHYSCAIWLGASVPYQNCAKSKSSLQPSIFIHLHPMHCSCTPYNNCKSFKHALKHEHIVYCHTHHTGPTSTHHKCHHKV